MSTVESPPSNRYRKLDKILVRCTDHGALAVACCHAGKVGKSRTAAISATTFWLTCPMVNSVLGRLEHDGVIKLLTRLLFEDTHLLQLHVESHALYHSRAKEEMETEELRQLFTLQFFGKKFGNAGVNHEQDVKCVHALVAQTLCGAPHPFGSALVRFLLNLRSTLNSLNSNIETGGKEAGVPCRAEPVSLVVLLQHFLRENAPTCYTPLVHDEELGSNICEASRDVTAICLGGRVARTRKKRRIN